MSHFDELNRRGLFPAPNEGERAFYERVARSSTFFEGELLTSEERVEADRLTQKLFGFSADWFTAYYSDEKLPFWQGAVAWSDENNTPFVQLRKGFKKGHYLHLYTREEVLAHEAIHAVRMGFHDPRFEELLAYQTSSHRWRRFLGPLFRHSWEPTVFLVLLLFSLIGEFFLFEILSLLPLSYLLFLFMRLWRTQRVFRSYLKKMSAVLTKPQELALRLTDSEITQFAKNAPEKILEIVKSQHSFRWQFLQKLYF